MEPTLEQSIAQLLSKAPAPVRKFILNDLSVATQRLMERYKLHVDQAGVLEAELLIMLVGQSKPEDFVRALVDAGIANETVQAIVGDINTEVFKRIREEEREQPQENQLMTESTYIGPKPPVARAPVPIYSPLPASSAPSVPPSRVEPPPNLPGQMPEPTRPVPPPPHIEVPAPVAAPQPAKEAPVPQQDPHNRIIHTMARDMEAVKSGVDPLRVAHPAPPSWAEAQTKPAPVVPPPPVVPPQPQVEHPAPPIAPSSIPPAPAVHEAPHPQEALRTHLKQYGVDPYREPVE